MNRLQSKLEKIGRDPKITAKSVGLRYSVNINKGYYRHQTDDGFFYADENGKKVRSKPLLTRFQKLVLPPAWQDVWISPHENGHLQATGIDAKGRKQYRYHAQWNKIRNQSKFYKLLGFAKALPAIRAQVETDLARTGIPYEKVLALVVKLIELTNIRIGNDAYKKLYGSFGLTTMQDKHVKFEKSKVWFQFVGKKGIKHKMSVESKKLVNLIKKCKDIPGQDLFQYYTPDGQHCCIGSSDVNNYLKAITGEDYTAKDFRAWAGSVKALECFRKLERPETQTEYRRKVVEVLDEVASNLGNTRAVCKKYYVHPTVMAAFENGNIAKYPPNKRKRDLDPEEYALVNLLENEKIAEVLG